MDALKLMAQSSMKELNDCVDKLVEFSARGAHGICAVRTFSTRGVSGTVSGPGGYYIISVLVNY